MPVTLPNLYCQPADVWDYLSTEGVNLRLDDHNLSTGQTITVTADALVGATAIQVAPLQFPLLPGTQIQFDGANMPAPVQVILSSTALVGATSLVVPALTVQVNNLSTAYDSGVNVALGQRLVKSCSYATAQVKLWCAGRYNDSDLVQSWSVNRWATAIASRWLAKRRAQACPQGIEDDFKEAKDEMKLVKMAALNIEDIGPRSASWPFISNMTVDPSYTYAKLRVEEPISEGTPTQYAQNVDWGAVFYLEW